jgi:hypothetical protein
MPFIRIHENVWGRVWRVLVASGPISRVSQEPVYFVSAGQVRLLRRKKLPFLHENGNSASVAAEVNDEKLG